MAHQEHWPFGADGDANAHARAHTRHAGGAGAGADAAERRAALGRWLRHDRLLVGGRAHVRKRGLT